MISSLCSRPHTVIFLESGTQASDQQFKYHRPDINSDKYISTNKIFPLTCEYTVDIEGSDGEEESSVTERVKLDLLQVYFIICNKSA